MQLAEMDRSPEGSTPSTSTSSAANRSTASNGDLAGASRKSTDSLASGVGTAEEDDKERTIAKAALSIAELSK